MNSTDPIPLTYYKNQQLYHQIKSSVPEELLNFTKPYNTIHLQKLEEQYKDITLIERIIHGSIQMSKLHPGVNLLIEENYEELLKMDKKIIELLDNIDMYRLNALQYKSILPNITLYTIQEETLNETRNEGGRRKRRTRRSKSHRNKSHRKRN